MNYYKLRPNISECFNEKEFSFNQNISSKAIDFANNSHKVSKWSVEQVSNWIISLGLEQYVDLFKKNKIDGRELLHLSQDMLSTALKIGNA